MDEMQLRTVAVALRTALAELLSADVAGEWDAKLAAALRLPPGRAMNELRRLMISSGAPPSIHSWVLARLGEAAPGAPDHVRLGEPPDRPAERQADALQGVDEHLLAIWIEEREESDVRPLQQAHPYALVVVASTDGSLARYFTAAVPTADVPPGGLDTRWVLSSTSVRLELDPGDPEVVVGTVQAGDRTQWQATFPLVIPSVGDSLQRRLRATPLTAPDARLDAVIMVGDEVYRRIALSLDVRSISSAETSPESSPRSPVAMLTTGSIPAAHTSIRPPVEWQRPVQKLEIIVVSSREALARSDGLGISSLVRWRATAGDLEAKVTNVRAALDRLRNAFPGQLDGIKPDRLRQDLQAYVPSADWTTDPDTGIEANTAVVKSDELRELAFEGNQLYRLLFEDDELREYVDRLQPGDRLTLNWMEGMTDRVPYVPLPLLYIDDVSGDRAVDPLAFLGLRFRLGYMRRQAKGSRALGDWRRTTRAHLLYRGDGTGADLVGDEARRHLEELRQWGGALVLPDADSPPESAKMSLGRFLTAPPAPPPLSLVYFYCHCTSGSGTDPQLRFGPTNAPGNILRRVDMGSAPFADEPVVFVNACGSSEADPLLLNQLMDLFLVRGCRGYIGTEGRVPAGLAARFATSFFTFLYGTADRNRAPVGEAVAQARRFLWRQYGNLGGLFYSYVNDVLLYAADDKDILALRTPDTISTEDHRER